MVSVWGSSLFSNSPFIMAKDWGKTYLVHFIDQKLTWLLMHPFSFPGQKGPHLAGMYLQVLTMNSSFSAALHTLKSFGQRL